MTEDLYKSVGETIAGLQAHFVRHRQFNQLEHQFQILLHRRQADIANQRANETRGLAVIGASGSGKTTGVERLLRSHLTANRCLPCEGNSEGDPEERQIISLRIPSPATVKFVGLTILRGLGYPMNGNRQAWYIWNLVKYHLQQRRTLILHLDEAQDLSAKGTERERQSVVNLLKSLMQDPDWPVCLILSGTDELVDILNFDPQLGRRFQPICFDPISDIADLPRIDRVLRTYAEKVPLELAAEVTTPEFLQRLTHAAANEFGLMIEIIISGIEVALLRRSKTLAASDFIEAFRLRAGCLDGLNPFCAVSFRETDPRELMARGGLIR